MTDIYFSIRKKGESMFRDRGSRFIGLSFPVADEAATTHILEEVRKKYHDARHHCYAYIIGTQSELFKANDDGEPNHSAGDPILGQIRSRELTNTLVVVVRYFGGTKLGVSGLINAYKTAASDCLENSGTLKHQITIRFQVAYNYDQTSNVMKLLSDFELIPKNESFEVFCTLQADVPLSKENSFVERLQESKDRNWIKEFSRIES